MDNADSEGDESRNDRVGKGRWYQDASRQQLNRRQGKPVVPTRIEGRFERDSKTSGVKNVGSILNAVRLSSFAMSLSKGDWASTSSHARQQIPRPT